MGEESLDIYLHGAQLVIAIGAAIMAIAYGIRRVYRMAKSVDDTLQMVRENNEATQKAREQIEAIRKEVTPNGGQSLRDAVNRIDHKVHDLEHVFLTHVVESEGDRRDIKKAAIDNYFKDHPEAKR